MPDIKINAALWKRLSREEQADIEERLRASNLLGTAERVVGSDTSIPPEVDLAALGDACKIACEAAAAAGKVACFKLVVPWKIAACLAAVEEARKLCRKACD